ncbi:MAG TPA: type IX secretion system plug protein domain-containing protein, partial [Chitinophagaceae bacterium]|nr:type IX secretion system plug protein domain-containing protein [Chitinophagaceae bacterium]
FDYIKGFSQQRINTYRVSTLAYTRYTHYQAVLPDRNCMPSRSGNYILKVFLDGDTSKVAFTKRLLVYEDRAIIAAQVQQPYNTQVFRTHQKVQFKVNTKNLSVVNALQQINIAILQNSRWDNAVRNIRPTFMTNNQLEYNTEQDAVFAAGKEWRWLDLRSFRLQSDRVMNAKYTNTSTEIFVKPDQSRKSYQFSFYRDINGFYSIEPSESVNPYWQADYATVRFTYIPPNNIPYPDKDVYLFGMFTNYGMDDSAKMRFNADKGVYETSLFLKQGYYDFSYVTLDRKGSNRQFSFDETEGNYWESENEYTILVYYRELGGRADQLVGVTKINSLTGRPGF